MGYRLFLLSTILGIVANQNSASAGGGPSTGNIPLIDLGVGTYEGFQGGLYPGGSNVPPLNHANAALVQAGLVTPRNAAGAPDPNGWIVIVSIGMSNTAQEFAHFEREADLNVDRNARVVIVNGAYNGTTAEGLANPQNFYWNEVNKRLTAMGLTVQQVQVVWIKQVNIRQPDNFPIHANELNDDLSAIVRVIKDKYPNAVLGYLSSRLFGGLSTTDRSPETHAYETGFSIKWLIEDQINGDVALNFNPANGAVEAPLLLWGPYLWADGVIPRSDGLTWVQSDYQSDGVHLSPVGRVKFTAMMNDFLASEPSAVPWYYADTSVVLTHVNVIADAGVKQAQPGVNFGSDTVLNAKGGTSVERTYLRFDVSGVARPVRRAKLSVPTFNGGGGRLSLVTSTSWLENTITYINAPAVGSLIATVPVTHRDETIAIDVTSAVNADADGVISFALTETTGTRRTYTSRESGNPARLILVVDE